MPFNFVMPIYLAYALIVLNGAGEILIKQIWFKRACVVFSALVLILLAGFRSVGVGSDDAAYVSMFEGIPPFFGCEQLLCGYSYGQFNIEVGFFTLLSMLRNISAQYELLFGFIAFVAVVFNIRAIKFFLPQLGAGLIVYFCHFYLNKELNAIRLGLASAVLFWAATYVPARRYGMALLWVAGAACIHVSSVLFLVPLAVYVLRPGRATYAIVGLGIIAVASFLDTQALFQNLVGLGFVGEKLASYLNADIYNYALPLVSAVNIKNLLFLVLAIVFWNRISAKFEHFQWVFCFYYCAVFIRIVLGDFAIVAGRSYAAISMFEYVLIPYVIFALCGKWLGYWTVVVYAGLILYLNLTVNAGWTGDALQFF